MLWNQLYNLNGGLLNQMIQSFGLPRVPWLNSPKMAMPSIAIMATWKNVGLYIILFLVGLKSVPRSMYEAADIEGASEKASRHYRAACQQPPYPHERMFRKRFSEWRLRELS